MQNSAFFQHGFTLCLFKPCLHRAHIFLFPYSLLSPPPSVYRSASTLFLPGGLSFNLPQNSVGSRSFPVFPTGGGRTPGGITRSGSNSAVPRSGRGTRKMPVHLGGAWPHDKLHTVTPRRLKCEKGHNGQKEEIGAQLHDFYKENVFLSACSGEGADRK